MPCPLPFFLVCHRARPLTSKLFLCSFYHCYGKSIKTCKLHPVLPIFFLLAKIPPTVYYAHPVKWVWSAFSCACELTTPTLCSKRSKLGDLQTTHNYSLIYLFNYNKSFTVFTWISIQSVNQKMIPNFRLGVGLVSDHNVPSFLSDGVTGELTFDFLFRRCPHVITLSDILSQVVWNELVHLKSQNCNLKANSSHINHFK